MWQALVARSAACNVPEREGLEAMKFYVAVKELIAQHQLDALTIGCYPHLMGRPCPVSYTHLTLPTILRV